MRLDVTGRLPLLKHGPQVEDDGRRELTIDLSRLHFASPLDLAAVAALAEVAIQHGQPVTMIRPEDPGVDAYVARMDLYICLDPRVRISGDALAVEKSARTDVLVEVGRIRSAQAASEMGERFANIAKQQGFGNAVPGLFRALGELLDNAATHGQSEAGAFAAAQFYTGATSDRQGLELAVCDTGVGVRQHLNQHRQRFTTDRTALDRAVLAPITGTDEHGRGWGLSDVVQYVGAHERAAFVIASGSSALYTSQRDGLISRRLTALATPIEGTWVWLRVRLPMKGR